MTVDYVHISTGQTDVAAPYWQSSLTSAFAFVEVEKPAAAIKTVETAYKLTPAIVGSNADLLTLSFDGLSHIAVMSDADAYIANEKGDRDEGACHIRQHIGVNHRHQRMSRT